MIEESNFNNTLAPWNNCPNANNDIYNFGFNASDTWQNIYLKNTVKRLQQYIDGVELTIADVAAMQQLCAYETVSLGFSKFCDLFTEEEWEGFEYWLGECYLAFFPLSNDGLRSRQTFSSGTSTALETQPLPPKVLATFRNWSLVSPRLP